MSNTMSKKFFFSFFFGQELSVCGSLLGYNHLYFIFHYFKFIEIRVILHFHIRRNGRKL